MKILTQPLFLIAIALASFIYLAPFLHIPLPSWMRFYVNDALCMPIVLSFCLLGIRVIKRDISLYLPIRPILVLTISYAIYFEYYLPKYNPRYTADWIDVGLYAVGSVLFYTFQKKLY